MKAETVFNALANRQRRQLLAGLRTQDPQRVRELSRESRELMLAHDALLEAYLTGSMTVENTDKALVRMYRVHLPALDRQGFVEWDRDANLVTKGPRFDALRPVLETMDTERTDVPERDRAVIR